MYVIHLNILRRNFTIFQAVCKLLQNYTITDNRQQKRAKSHDCKFQIWITPLWNTRIYGRRSQRSACKPHFSRSAACYRPVSVWRGWSCLWPLGLRRARGPAPPTPRGRTRPCPGLPRLLGCSVARREAPSMSRRSMLLPPETGEEK